MTTTPTRAGGGGADVEDGEVVRVLDRGWLDKTLNSPSPPTSLPLPSTLSCLLLPLSVPSPTSTNISSTPAGFPSRRFDFGADIDLDDRDATRGFCATLVQVALAIRSLASSWAHVELQHCISSLDSARSLRSQTHFRQPRVQHLKLTVHQLFVIDANDSLRTIPMDYFDFNSTNAFKAGFCCCSSVEVFTLVWVLGFVQTLAELTDSVLIQLEIQLNSHASTLWLFAFEPRWINCEAERRDTTRPVEADCTTPVSMTLGLDLFTAEIRLQLLISGRTDFRVNEGSLRPIPFVELWVQAIQSSDADLSESYPELTSSPRRGDYRRIHAVMPPLASWVVGLQAAYTLETRFYWL
ncbi:hypothetical protein R3P38DRAFT_3167003 [Favolaschia claudopus]|uniref:Uncharacterized protein n=1 Tax=Favolaschia claudopus TaxID=2862362 RepID=A0AAW0EF50_9AGAR